MLPILAAALPSISGFLAKKGLGLLSKVFKGAANAGIQRVADQIHEKTGIDINQAINENLTEDQLMELRAFELQQEVELSRIAVEQLDIINKTMQIEAQSEHWPQYSWRPFWGFVSGIAFLIVIIFCCYLAYIAIKEGSVQAINMISPLITSFVPLFGIAGAVLGISSWHRGKEKIENTKSRMSSFRNDIEG